MSEKNTIYKNIAGQYAILPNDRYKAEDWEVVASDLDHDQAESFLISKWNNIAFAETNENPFPPNFTVKNIYISGEPLPEQTPASCGRKFLAFAVNGNLSSSVFESAVKQSNTILKFSLDKEKSQGVIFTKVTGSSDNLITDDLRLTDLAEVADAYSQFEGSESAVFIKLVALKQDAHLLLFLFDENLHSELLQHQIVGKIFQLYNLIANEQEESTRELEITTSPRTHDNHNYQKWEIARDYSSIILELPTVSKTAVAKTYEYECCDVLFSSNELNITTCDSGTPRFTDHQTLFISALQALIYRYTNTKQFTIGFSELTSIDFDPESSLSGTWQPLNTDINGNITVEQLLHETSLRLHEASQSTHSTLMDFVCAQKLSYDDQASQIYQVGFNYYDLTKGCELSLTGCAIKPLSAPSDKAGWFKLYLQIHKQGNKFCCRLNFHKEVFERSTIERMLDHYANIVRGMQANQHAGIGELPMLSRAELNLLLKDWNLEKTCYPSHLDVVTLFRQQVEANPENIALKGLTQSYTYRELDLHSNKLARYLLDSGVTAKHIVAIFLPRTPEVIISILAVVKCGATYLPLEPSYPTERIDYMLSDAGVGHVISEEKLKSRLPFTDVKVLLWSRIATSMERFSETPLSIISTIDSLAYIIYTSGSTGKPKGIMVPHRGIIRLVKNTNYISIKKSDVVMQFSPATFDASVFEIWGPLLNGATLQLGPPGKVGLDELARFFVDYKITICLLIAPLFHSMVDHHLDALKNIKNLFVVGDVLSVSHVAKALGHLTNTKLINGYGPSENTTFTTCHHIRMLDVERNSIPIGVPISNTTTYVLDEYLNPLPVGVVGELYTGGDGVAFGYLNRPDLTAKTFLFDPFAKQKNARMYKTGDLAKYLPDGTIEFLGRIDDQVKIKGIRIEIGEIEATLNKHTALNEVIVFPQSADNGEKYLAVYATHAPSTQNIGVSTLAEYLKERLPPHLIPDAIIIIDAFNLTPNGKIDRKTLPKPKAHDFINKEKFAYGVAATQEVKKPT